MGPQPALFVVLLGVRVPGEETAMAIRGCMYVNTKAPQVARRSSEALRYLVINNTLDSVQFDLANLEHSYDILHT